MTHLQILFVCLGNICRSPLAEGVFRELVKKRGLSDKIACDSAGTAGYHIGNLPDHRSRRIAHDYGISLTHKARKLVSDDYGQFDYIVAMDTANFDHIQSLSYRITGFDMPEDRLILFRQFDSIDPNTDVPDPYYEDMAAFDEVYQIAVRCSESLLDFLTETHNLA